VRHTTKENQRVLAWSDMSEQQPILFPQSAREVDIADEIAEHAQDHVPFAYLEHLASLTETSRSLALHDLVHTTRQLLREFTVCHDLALSQLVRAHKSSAATQRMLLSGGLEKLLGFENAKNTSLDELFYMHVLGPVPARSTNSMMEPGVNTLRNRMVNLSGSERAGVGLGAIAAIYNLSKATLPHITHVSRQQEAGPMARGPMTPYGALLAEALRDIAVATPARRAVAFGATQAFQIGDDLFAFLKARTARA
jgi:hypothetical protein